MRAPGGPRSNKQLRKTDTMRDRPDTSSDANIDPPTAGMAPRSNERRRSNPITDSPGGYGRGGPLFSERHAPKIMFNLAVRRSHGLDSHENWQSSGTESLLIRAQRSGLTCWHLRFTVLFLISSPSDLLTEFATKQSANRIGLAV